MKRENSTSCCGLSGKIGCKPLQRQCTVSEDLDSPIPECDDSVGELGMLQMCECVSSQTKVSQFQVTFIVDQQVGCLEVTMDHTIDVAMCKAIAQLLHV